MALQSTTQGCWSCSLHILFNKCKRYHATRDLYKPAPNFVCANNIKNTIAKSDTYLSSGSLFHSAAHQLFSNFHPRTRVCLSVSAQLLPAFRWGFFLCSSSDCCVASSLIYSSLLPTVGQEGNHYFMLFSSLLKSNWGLYPNKLTFLKAGLIRI